MNLFTIRIEVAPIELRLTNNQPSDSGLKEKLVQLTADFLNFKEITMTAITDATAKIEALNTKVEKIKTEVQALIDAAANGGAGNTTPEFDAALAKLEVTMGTLDDMNVDAAPPAPGG